MTSLPLTGLKVLELGSSLAGPYACRILSDMGAQIYKVEQPDGGDPSRHWGQAKLGGVGIMYQASNRGKDSVTVDFTDEKQLAGLKQFIAAEIDIIVQNLRPGVVETFGLDAGSALALNSQLIYCNLSAFGSEGPLRNEPGYDPLIQAYSGLIDATGETGGGPVRVPVQIIDIGSGMWAAMGVLGALQLCQKTKKGCVVDASMFETALGWQTIASAMTEAGQEPPWRTGLTGPLLVPNDGYETGDGILLITIATEAQYARFCTAIGLPELTADPRFNENNSRIRNSDAFREAIEAKLKMATREEWVAKFSAVGVPTAPILTLVESLEHPQTRASGILQSSPDGSFRIVGLPLKFDGKRPEFNRNAPELGNATQAVFDFMNSEK